MEEEMCLVDSCTTNTILREVKFFQTLTKREGQVLTIAGRDAMIVGSGRATFILPMGTQIHIEEALLYPDSTRTLLSYRDIRKMDFMWKHMKNTIRSSSSSQKIPDMANKHLKKCLLSRLDCTTHTSNPYHILHTK